MNITYIWLSLAIALALVLRASLLRKFGSRKPYAHMVGDTAYVGSGGIGKSESGEVTWSGTIMRAELVADANVDRLEAGSPATIVSVKGATLMVKPGGA